MRYRYEVRWTQRRSKKRALLPRRIVAETRQEALQMFATALKENAGLFSNLPRHISITLASKDNGPSRVEWSKQ